MTLEISLTVSLIGKNTPNLWVSSYNFRFYSQRNEHICQQKDLYKNVHSSLKHNSQSFICPSIKEWIKKH